MWEPSSCNCILQLIREMITVKNKIDRFLGKIREKKLILDSDTFKLALDLYCLQKVTLIKL